MTPFKFGTRQGENQVPFSYPNVWEQGHTTGPDRLLIAPASGHVALLRKLADVLPEPFGILYVLVVPRGGGEPGRYQSLYPCSRAEVDAFLTRFEAFFERDGRHHVWLLSLPASATLVYDNHNVRYAYGPLDEFKPILERAGLREGEIRFPDPHSHNYHAEFDGEEAAVMAYDEWRHFPLKEQDDR